MRTKTRKNLYVTNNINITYMYVCCKKLIVTFGILFNKWIYPLSSDLISAHNDLSTLSPQFTCRILFDCVLYVKFRLGNIMKWHCKLNVDAKVLHYTVVKWLIKITILFCHHFISMSCCVYVCVFKKERFKVNVYQHLIF